MPPPSYLQAAVRCAPVARKGAGAADEWRPAVLGFKRLSSSEHKRSEGVRMTIDADGGCCAERPPRTEVTADSAASCCRAAFLHLMAVARRRGDVTYLKATCRQPALVPPNSYCRGVPSPHVHSRPFERPFDRPSGQVDGEGID